jgi:hypothetical protein
MIRPMLDWTVFGCALAQRTQLTRPYDSKTDQTDQTDQRLETAGEFGAPPRSELTSCHAKLTSGGSKLTSRAAGRSPSRPSRANNPGACTLHAAARQPPP